MSSRPATAAYLRRLGVDADLPPTLETLVLLHHRHQETVPYENLSTMLGRPPSVEPADSVDRVARLGRAGYCFHQNGALGAVLQDLGFAVSRRHGHVYVAEEDRFATSLNHLVIVVEGLPTPGNPAGRWWPDVGLGDAFRDPLPLVVGEQTQGGFTYAITEVREDGWSFRHDASGSFTGMEASSLPVDAASVQATHAGLTSAPDGRFARILVVQRRDEHGADTVRGCLWTRVNGEERSETELTTYDDWRSALADELRLRLDDIEEAELRALWERSWAAHQEWTAAGRP